MRKTTFNIANREWNMLSAKLGKVIPKKQDRASKNVTPSNFKLGTLNLCLGLPNKKELVK
jgi:hypothetical protein